MSNKILRLILVLSSLLVLVIFFIYRSYGWPLGREGLEALISFLIFGVSLFLLSRYLRIRKSLNQAQVNSVKIGLFAGLLWTIEISINNIIRPGLPNRDIYDDIFWAAIAIVILFTAVFYAFKIGKVSSGILVGFWSGIASGAVAGLTALLFIVFGMSQILLDPLNISEWAIRGGTSGIPNIAVYFAYQTLAGAVLHLVVLGVVMGVLLGAGGGFLGKNLKTIFRK